jgi:predicted histidine transporter YuiF (NhaC family)
LKKKREECTVDYCYNPQCIWVWGNSDFPTPFSRKKRKNKWKKRKKRKLEKKMKNKKNMKKKKECTVDYLNALWITVVIHSAFECGKTVISPYHLVVCIYLFFATLLSRKQGFFPDSNKLTTLLMFIIYICTANTNISRIGVYRIN